MWRGAARRTRPLTALSKTLLVIIVTKRPYCFCVQNKQRKVEQRQGCGDTNAVTGAEIESDETTSQEYQLYYIRPEGSPSLTVGISINQAQLKMEVDTGAALSIISESTHQNRWSSGEATHNNRYLSC